MLEFCEKVAGSIKNGCTEGDWEGKSTYVEGEGISVLDLVIEIENEVGSIIKKIHIESKIDSDLLPVEIYVEKREKGESSEREYGKGKEEKGI